MTSHDTAVPIYEVANVQHTVMDSNIQPLHSENHSNVDHIEDSVPHVTDVTFDSLGIEYLNAIEVEKLEFSRQTHRKRKWRTVKIAPITVAPTADDQSRAPSSEQSRADAAWMAENANNVHADGEISRHVTPRITLLQQKDDVFFCSIINYIETGELPSDRNKARQLLFQENDYFMKDQKLWRLGLVRNKRLREIQPRQKVYDCNHHR